MEGDEGATLFHGFEGLCRYDESDFLAEFGDKHSLLLEVDMAAALARRVELGRADTIRIPTAYLGVLSCDCAYSCHSGAYGSIQLFFMQPLDTIFVLIILIFSAIIHEVMHGVAAEWLGDKTARYAGRITLNPLSHLDPVGSVIVPLILTLSHSPLFFAWAKPVPYNPYNLRPGRFSEAIVAFAGPFSNFVLALLVGIIIRLHIFDSSVNEILFLIVMINIMLCFFNLIPIPPLDGSKVFEAILPRSLSLTYFNWRQQMDRNPFLGMGLVLIAILVLGGVFANAVYTLASLISGM